MRATTEELLIQKCSQPAVRVVQLVSDVRSEAEVSQ
jgi:hypothetical protein